MNWQQKTLTVIALLVFIASACFAPYKHTRHLYSALDWHLVSEDTWTCYAPIFKSPDWLDSTNATNDFVLLWPQLGACWAFLVVVYVGGLFLLTSATPRKLADSLS